MEMGPGAAPLKLWVPAALLVVVAVALAYFYFLALGNAGKGSGLGLANVIGLAGVVVGLVAAGVVMRRFRLPQ
jgi:hypothetical protein